MQSISGILVIDPAHARLGSATVDFDRIPRHGERVGNARMRQPILVNAERGVVVSSVDAGRPFEGLPAYLVHIRRWHHEDRTSFDRDGGEMDEYVIDSNVTSERLEVSWNLGDEGALVELGFICVGQ